MIYTYILITIVIYIFMGLLFLKKQREYKKNIENLLSKNKLEESKHRELVYRNQHEIQRLQNKNIQLLEQNTNIRKEKEELTEILYSDSFQDTTIIRYRNRLYRIQKYEIEVNPESIERLSVVSTFYGTLKMQKNNACEVEE